MEKGPAFRDHLASVAARVIACQNCPRLVQHRQMVARQKRRAYQDQEYWGRPVPGWGDPQARLLVVGLAPGAHGANRTGLPFTGDSSAQILLPALAQTGFANRSDLNANVHLHPRVDSLHDVYLTNVVRCVPPDNRPTAQERDNCLLYLQEEIRLLPHLEIILALGKFAFEAALSILPLLGAEILQPRPKFSHGLQVRTGKYILFGSYHPSRRNTQTGRLTAGMLEAVLSACSAILT
jgi:uracil-DNA glycosylase family 4